jgi:hypothetical protein
MVHDRPPIRLNHAEYYTMHDTPCFRFVPAIARDAGAKHPAHQLFTWHLWTSAPICASRAGFQRIRHNEATAAAKLGAYVTSRMIRGTGKSAQVIQ